MVTGESGRGCQEFAIIVVGTVSVHLSRFVALRSSISLHSIISPLIAETDAIHAYSRRVDTTLAPKEVKRTGTMPQARAATRGNQDSRQSHRP